jgi:uncharacterized protein YcfJ
MKVLWTLFKFLKKTLKKLTISSFGDSMYICKRFKWCESLLQMKKFFFVSGVFFSALSAQAQQFAEVVSVQPRMVTTSEQVCEQVAVQKPATSGNVAGGVLGAIAGAAIGNQVGGGSGRDIATAAGAVIGHQIGRGEPQPSSVEYQNVCRFVPVTVQRGELVTFRYKGRTFTQAFD